MSASPSSPDKGRLIGERLTAALTEDRRWQLLFLDYVALAIRDPAVGRAFTAHRRRVRDLVAEAASALVGDHPAYQPDELAAVVLALSNGLAIERLTDPSGVTDQLFGRVLQDLLGPSRRHPLTADAGEAVKRDRRLR